MLIRQKKADGDQWVAVVEGATSHRVAGPIGARSMGRPSVKHGGYGEKGAMLKKGAGNGEGPMTETSGVAAAHLRVARSTDDLAAIVRFYRDE